MTKNNEMVSNVLDKLIIDSEYEFDSSMPLLSVVIPVYNVEKYISRCLNSIIKQTYRNIEIIVVNDFSKEKEDEIIQEFCKKDSRIKYVKHEKNMGLFQARITGMKYATGNYFAFLDSDDHISIDYYRLLIKKINETNADIVIGDFIDEYDDGRLEYYNFDNTRFKDILLEDNQVYDTFMKQHGLWFGWHTVWNKIYKKTVWDKSHKILEKFSKQHGHLIMTEDIAYSCIFWKFAHKVVNCHNAFYYYFHHSGQSVSNANFDKFSKNVKDVHAVFEFFREFLEIYNIYEKYKNDFKEFRELYIQFWTGNADALDESERIKARNLVIELFGHVNEMKYKDHFHYSLKTSINSFKFYEDIKENICSEKTKVVSFDIFDTLLLRPFYKPSDIFALMNITFNDMIKGYSYVDFEKIRINVEAALRKEVKPIEEITLNEIYKRIGLIFRLSKEQIEILKNKEIDLEYEFTRQRKTGKELFELAQTMNKKIICISDMYLPQNVVLNMLKKCGYNIKNIYLSSEYLRTKNTGKLYDFVLEQENIKAEEIVHIGDNWDSDIVMAQNKGIRAYHLASTMSLMKGENPGTYTGYSYYKIFAPSGKVYMGESAAEYLGIRCMLALIANKIFDNPYVVQFNEDTEFNCNPYYIGYYILGMHLYAVTNWIAQTVQEQKKNTIHFVSRDGYLPKKAFEILKQSRNININTNYLYVSRKATALLQTSSITDIISYLNSFSSFSIPVEKVMDTFSCLANKEFLDNINTLSDNDLISFSKTKDFSHTMNFGGIIKDQYVDVEKAEKFISEAKKYFTNIIGNNDILFDLGYRANKEYILSTLINRPVDCLYIYTNESKALERARKKNFVIKTFYDYTPSVYAATRELVFSEMAPSCTGYSFEGKMKPIFDTNYCEHYFNKFVIGTMQEAALDFVKDFEQCFSNTEIPYLFRNYDASLPFEYFINFSKELDRHIFGCITFEDDTFAGGQIKLVDEWQKALNYHKLNTFYCEENTENINETNNNINKQKIVQDVENIYSDGLFVKAFYSLNKKFPIGSKKRELLKKLIKPFLH